MSCDGEVFSFWFGVMAGFVTGIVVSGVILTGHSRDTYIEYGIGKYSETTGSFELIPVEEFNREQ